VRKLPWGCTRGKSEDPPESGRSPCAVPPNPRSKDGSCRRSTPGQGHLVPGWIGRDHDYRLCGNLYPLDQRLPVRIPYLKHAVSAAGECQRSFAAYGGGGHRALVALVQQGKGPRHGVHGPQGRGQGEEHGGNKTESRLRMVHGINTSVWFIGSRRTGRHRTG
jgi:hypothetical protein